MKNNKLISDILYKTLYKTRQLPVRQLHHQPVVPSFSVFIFCRKTLTEKFFVKVREGPLDGLS